MAEMSSSEKKELIRKMPWGVCVLFVLMALLLVHLFLPQKYQLYTFLGKTYDTAIPTLKKARLIGDNEDLTHPRKNNQTDSFGDTRDGSPDPLKPEVKKIDTLVKPMIVNTIEGATGVYVFDGAAKLNKKEFQALEILCKNAQFEKKVIIEIHIEQAKLISASSRGSYFLKRILKRKKETVKALVICLAFQENKTGKKRSIAIVRSGNLEKLFPDNEIRSLENTYFLPPMRDALSPDYGKGLSDGLVALLEIFNKGLKHKK